MNIKEFVGKTFASVEKHGDDEIVFTEAAGRAYRMHHSQDCCESVYIESIVGDLSDLTDEPILLAEEATSEQNPEGAEIPNYQDCFLWTFYKLATRKGYVDLRWYGDSNGYYSVSVDLDELAR
jgi:hypothetical protein